MPSLAFLVISCLIPFLLRQTNIHKDHKPEKDYSWSNLICFVSPIFHFLPCVCPCILHYFLLIGCACALSCQKLCLCSLFHSGYVLSSISTHENFLRFSSKAILSWKSPVGLSAQSSLFFLCLEVLYLEEMLYVLNEKFLEGCVLSSSLCISWALHY